MSVKVKGQLWTSFLSHYPFSFRRKVFPGSLELSKWARLADRQATEIHLSLPSQTWDHKFTLIWPFTRGFWGKNLGPYVCTANTLANWAISLQPEKESSNTNQDGGVTVRKRGRGSCEVNSGRLLRHCLWVVVSVGKAEEVEPPCSAVTFLPRSSSTGTYYVHRNRKERQDNGSSQKQIESRKSSNVRGCFCRDCLPARHGSVVTWLREVRPRPALLLCTPPKWVFPG